MRDSSIIPVIVASKHAPATPQIAVASGIHASRGPDMDAIAGAKMRDEYNAAMQDYLKRKR